MIIKINGIDINYIREGNGVNTILVLHGWGASIQAVTPIIDMLKNDFEVFSIDFPGCGMSQKPNKVWGTYDYVDLVKQFIDLIGLKEIILVGHSHGGKTALVFSYKYPEITKKVVLIACTGVKPKRKIKYYIRTYGFKMAKKATILLGKKRDLALEFLYKKFGSEDYKNAQGIMRKIIVKVINEDFCDIMGKIRIPTLLIWGENDTYTPVYMGKIINKKIKNSGIVVLKNAGHYVYIDQYYAFNLVINNFLSGSN